MSRRLHPDEHGVATLILWHHGDASVGIGGDQARVQVWVGDDPEYQQFVCESLRETFSAIWDFRTYCMDEREALSSEEF